MRGGALGDGLKRRAGMGHQIQPGLMHVVVVGHGRDINHAFVRRIPDLAPAGAHLNGVIAQTQHQIGLLDQRHQMFVGQGRQARAAKAQRMILGDHALGLVGGHEGNAEMFQKRLHHIARIVIQHIQTHNRDRPFRLRNPSAGLRHTVTFGRDGGNLGAAARFNPRHTRIRDRDRHVDMHRAGAWLVGQ